MIYEHLITYSELKQTYIDLISGKKVCKVISNNSKLDDLVSNWKNKSAFYGPSSAQLIEWLHNGYHQPGLTLDPPIEPIRKKRRLQFAEEGELQIDLAYSGHDYPFLSWGSRDVMPGMRVNVLLAFVSSTSVSITQEYQRWVLRALIALEEAGVDVEVWITSVDTNIFQGDSNNNLFTKIKVKEVGEQTDFLSWSPMFSPGGFRHLKFLEYVLGADANGKSITSNLGRGVNSGVPWSVFYDQDTQELNIRCPYSPSDFPEKEMEIQLREVLKEARRAA